MYDESEYDLEKYFLDSNKQKIYARKGSGHKNLAYDILYKTGLDRIYRKYEDYVPSAVFLTYCGYVLIDEAEERTIQDDPFEEAEVIKFTAIGYCSASINKEYIEYLRNEYGKPENEFDDSYESSFLPKETIDEIIKKSREFIQAQDNEWER